MSKRYSLLASVVIGLTASLAAVLAIKSTGASAQTSADCQILWADANSYKSLADKTAAYVSKGYVASGFTAQDTWLYVLVCRK